LKSGAPGIALVRDFIDEVLPYEGELEAEVFMSHLDQISTPDVFEFAAEYVDSIFRFHKNTAFLMSEDTEAAYQGVFADGAKALKGKGVLFSTSGEKKDYLRMLGSFLNVQPVDLPVLRIVEPKAPGSYKMRQYTYEGDLSALTIADMEKFVSDFKEGKLEQFHKS